MSFQYGTFPISSFANICDTYIRSDAPDDNSSSFAQDFYIGVNGAGGPINRAFMYFYSFETYILNSYNITDAYLTLAYYSGSMPLNNIGVYRIIGNITPQSNITWNSRVPSASELWTTHGGDIENVNLATNVYIGDEFVIYKLTSFNDSGSVKLKE